MAAEDAGDYLLITNRHGYAITPAYTNASGELVVAYTNGPQQSYTQTVDIEGLVVDGPTNSVWFADLTLTTTTNAITWPTNWVWAAGSTPEQSAEIEATVSIKVHPTQPVRAIYWEEE
jgi:hypothetical protein